MTAVVLKPAIPILFVRDVPASARFYATQLGFSIDFLHGDPPFYGAVSRDAACLHLRCVDQPNFHELAAREPSLIIATIEVSDIHALCKELADKDVIPVQAPTRQSWGGTDLHVRDLDGNIVSFVAFE